MQSISLKMWTPTLENKLKKLFYWDWIIHSTAGTERSEQAETRQGEMPRT